jgi:hypothetical protein
MKISSLRGALIRENNRPTDYPSLICMLDFISYEGILLRIFSIFIFGMFIKFAVHNCHQYYFIKP